MERIKTVTQTATDLNRHKICFRDLSRVAKAHPKWWFYAYKFVCKDRRPSMYLAPGLIYEKGAEIEFVPGRPDEDIASKSKDLTCAPGINVSTLLWANSNKWSGEIIIKVKFQGKDLLCVPDGSDGKFRVSYCKVLT